MRYRGSLIVLLALLAGFASLFSSCGKSDQVLQVVEVVDSLKVGLIAWYPFNNNSSADESPNGYNGTVFNINSANGRNGNANAAYQFNGFSAYMTVPDNGTLRLINTDFTLNAWIKLDAYNQSNVSLIFSKRASGAINGGWQMGIMGTTANVYTPANTGVVTYGADAGNTSAYGNKVIELNKWHMVTVEYTLDTKKLAIYVDGVLDNVTSNIVPANNLTSSALFIGKDSAVNSFYFQGAMDDLRIYNRVLSVKQLGYLLALTN